MNPTTLYRSQITVPSDQTPQGSGKKRKSPFDDIDPNNIAPSPILVSSAMSSAPSTSILPMPPSSLPAEPADTSNNSQNPTTIISPNPDKTYDTYLSPDSYDKLSDEDKDFYNDLFEFEKYFYDIKDNVRHLYNKFVEQEGFKENIDFETFIHVLLALVPGIGLLVFIFVYLPRRGISNNQAAWIDDALSQAVKTSLQKMYEQGMGGIDTAVGQSKMIETKIHDHLDARLSQYTDDPEKAAAIGHLQELFSSKMFHKDEVGNKTETQIDPLHLTERDNERLAYHKLITLLRNEDELNKQTLETKFYYNDNDNTRVIDLMCQSTLVSGPLSGLSKTQRRLMQTELCEIMQEVVKNHPETPGSGKAGNIFKHIFNKSTSYEDIIVATLNKSKRLSRDIGKVIASYEHIDSTHHFTKDAIRHPITPFQRSQMAAEIESNKLATNNSKLKDRLRTHEQRLHKATEQALIFTSIFAARIKEITNKKPCINPVNFDKELVRQGQQSQGLSNHLRQFVNPGFTAGSA